MELSFYFFHLFFQLQYSCEAAHVPRYPSTSTGAPEAGSWGQNSGWATANTWEDTAHWSEGGARPGDSHM